MFINVWLYSYKNFQNTLGQQFPSSDQHATVWRIIERKWVQYAPLLIECLNAFFQSIILAPVLANNVESLPNYIYYIMLFSLFTSIFSVICKCWIFIGMFLKTIRWNIVLFIWSAFCVDYIRVLLCFAFTNDALMSQIWLCNFVLGTMPLPGFISVSVALALTFETIREQIRYVL